jgi:hypothetical protein
VTEERPDRGRILDRADSGYSGFSFTEKQADSHVHSSLPLGTCIEASQRKKLVGTEPTPPILGNSGGLGDRRDVTGFPGASYLGGMNGGASRLSLGLSEARFLGVDSS